MGAIRAYLLGHHPWSLGNERNTRRQAPCRARSRGPVNRWARLVKESPPAGDASVGVAPAGPARDALPAANNARAQGPAGAAWSGATRKGASGVTRALTRLAGRMGQ